MPKKYQRILSFVYKRFTPIWAFLTLVALLFFLYCTVQFSYNNSNKDLSLLAKELSNEVDGFIEDLFQEVYTLPLYGSKLAQCDKELYEELDHILLNNPKISALTIRNEEHLTLCSTLPNSVLAYTQNLHPRAILGPFHLSLFDQPVYVIQQKVGAYYIDILLVASVLEQVLETSNELTSSVALYDQSQKKNLLRIKHSDDHNGWVITKNLEAKSPLESQYRYGIDKLQSLEGIALAVFENKRTVYAKLWSSELIVTILTLLTSYFLYILIIHRVTKHYSLHRALKLGIRNNEFFPEYQPIFDRESNTYTGMEILLRWQDNQDKIIMPAFFIKEAESSGLIVPITLQIVDIAFQETQDLIADNPHFHLSFNLSLLHFKDANFFNYFDELQKKYQIPNQQILFEVTERELLDKNDSIFTSKMHALREAGYSLAVDDFGTGHASISYLQNFPFNYLKIDKIFIHAIGTKAITESLNDAIIRMAKSLNLVIIAEGVETQEQVDYLLKNEVRFLQGWYFSKAVSIEIIHELLKERKDASSH